MDKNQCNQVLVIYQIHQYRYTHKQEFWHYTLLVFYPQILTNHFLIFFHLFSIQVFPQYNLYTHYHQIMLGLHHLYHMDCFPMARFHIRPDSIYLTICGNIYHYYTPGNIRIYIHHHSRKGFVHLVVIQLEHHKVLNLWF